MLLLYTASMTSCWEAEICDKHYQFKPQLFFIVKDQRQLHEPLWAGKANVISICVGVCQSVSEKLNLLYLLQRLSFEYTHIKASS